MRKKQQGKATGIYRLSASFKPYSVHSEQHSKKYNHHHEVFGKKVLFFVDYFSSLGLKVLMLNSLINQNIISDIKIVKYELK